MSVGLILTGNAAVPGRRQDVIAAARAVGLLGRAIERVQFGAPDQALVAELNVARAKYAPVRKAS